MTIAIFPLLFAIVGLVIYFAARGDGPNVGKAANVGLWTFIIGALWLVHAMSGRVLVL